MNKLNVYACCAEVIGFIFMPILQLGVIIKWGYSFFYTDYSVSLSYSDGIPSFPQEMMQSIATMPLWHKVAGFIIDELYVCLMVMLLLNGIYFMRLIRQGLLFSSQVFPLSIKISKIAAILMVYMPIQKSLTGLVMTLSKGPGNRIISFSIGTQELVNIAFFVLGMVLLLIVQEAFKVQQDIDLTI